MDFGTRVAESARMRGFVSLAAVLGALLVASGCGGGPAAEPDEGSRAAAPGDRASRLPQPHVRKRASAARSTAPTPSPVRVPTGFRTRRLGEDGVQISLPRRWTALARRDAIFPGVAQTLLRVDAGIRSELAALTFPDSPMKLLVLAPSHGAGFPATVSVVVSAAEGAPASVAEWEDDVRRSLVATARPVGGEIASRRVLLGVGAGVRMAYEQRKNGRRIAVVQYTSLAGGYAYLVRLTTTPRLLPSVVRDFDALAPTLSALAGSASAPAGRSAGRGLAPAA